MPKVVLKRKVCEDCGRKQGSHGQWINNQKLCAAHTGASDATIQCLRVTVDAMRPLLMKTGRDKELLISACRGLEAPLNNLKELVDEVLRR